MPGLEEGRLLTGEATPEAIARQYRDIGAQLVVIKLGADGAYFDGPGTMGSVPGAPVVEIDALTIARRRVPFGTSCLALVTCRCAASQSWRRSGQWTPTKSSSAP
jgi:hypothetical protein